MALTQITTAGIADSAITESKINASVALGGPKITAVEVTNSSYTVLDDTAVELGGGYIKITGTGFVSGVRVLVDNTSAISVQFISSTVVRAELPAKSAGSYIVYLVNPDGGVAISVNGVTYSGLPNWTSASLLPDNASGSPISIQLTAESASTYALAPNSTLPSGLSLSSSGLLSGNLPGIQSNTVYSFSVIATDAEFQESSRTFSLTITPPTQPGQVAFTTPGTYSWTVPESITNISAVCVGGGGNNSTSSRFGGGGGGLRYINNLPVTPGETLNLVIGSSQQNSSINRASNVLVFAGGGTNITGGTGSTIGTGPFGGTIGGGNGGSGGGSGSSFAGGGGGGAGGYSGNGGNAGAAGSSGTTGTTAGLDGSGGGGGGGGGSAVFSGGNSRGGGGGGVGIRGQGTSGTGGVAAPGGGGSGNFGGGGGGGSGGTGGYDGNLGGTYGGGGGGADNTNYFNMPGGTGAIRIIWGPGRVFPSTLTEDV